jgi:phosphoserine aminotransferase
MSRVYNFSAGPAAVPLEVLQKAQSEMLDWNGSGMSVEKSTFQSLKKPRRMLGS